MKVFFCAATLFFLVVPLFGREVQPTQITKYFKDYRIDDLTQRLFLYDEIDLHDLTGSRTASWELGLESIKRVLHFEPTGKTIYYEVHYDALSRPAFIEQKNSKSALSLALSYFGETLAIQSIQLTQPRVLSPGKTLTEKKIVRNQANQVFMIQTFVNGKLDFAENYQQFENHTTITSYTPEGRLRQIRYYQWDTKANSRNPKQLFYKEKNYSEHGEKFVLGTTKKTDGDLSTLSEIGTYTWVNNLTYDNFTDIDVEKIHEQGLVDLATGITLIRETGKLAYCDYVEDQQLYFRTLLQKKLSSPSGLSNFYTVFDGFDTWEDFEITRFDDLNPNLKQVDVIKNGFVVLTYWQADESAKQHLIDIKHEYYPNRRPFREWVYFENKLLKQDLFHLEDQMSPSKLDASLLKTSILYLLKFTQPLNNPKAVVPASRFLIKKS